LRKDSARERLKVSADAKKTTEAKEMFLSSLKKEKIIKPVRDAFEKVDKTRFFDSIFEERHFEDEPLPIGFGQHGDDPLALARMMHYLRPKKGWRVLEVGTGSGYSTALMASLVKEVITVEYYEKLAASAKERITGRGIENVRFFAGDVTDPSMEGKFEGLDGLIVYAGCRHTPYALINALVAGGTAVFPMGPAHQQQIILYRGDAQKGDSPECYHFHELCAFDSLRGRYGWVDGPEMEVVEEADVERGLIRDPSEEEPEEEKN
jgi:protein-L-isoaspartate(D-aspartate) O-methyltransferase